MLSFRFPTIGALGALLILHASAAAGPFDSGGASIADVTEKAIPSVVNISSTRVMTAQSSPYNYDPFFSEPGRRQGRKQYGQSLGSGVIVSKKGYVLTSNHVVAGAQDIKVALHDGRELDAEIVGSDPKSDLAVLKLKGKVPSDVTPIAFGDSSKLRLGDVVLAIGNPFGVGQTVTMGIVSAKGRANVGIVDYEDFIQTDAAINPGNSGGALVNMSGELIGINTAILSRSGGYQGIGFAIPSDMAGPIMKSLLEKGRVVRGYLGVEMQTMTKELARALGVDATSGAAVAEVVKKSPAARAGLKRHDVITRFGNREVRSAPQLRNAIAAAEIGKDVEVELVRAGKKQALKVQLEELRDQQLDPEAEAGGLADRKRGNNAAPSGEFGAVVRGLDKAVRKKYGIPNEIDTGVVVTDVPEGTYAFALGLQPGDLIAEINRVEVKTPRQFQKAFLDTQGQVALLIWRDGSTVYLAFTK